MPCHRGGDGLGQVVAVPRKPFDDRRSVARHAITAQPRRLQMRRGDDEGATLPATGGERWLPIRGMGNFASFARTPGRAFRRRGVVHVIVDGDVVSVGAVATSSLHDTFNSAESRATPLAAFIVLMSVMAEANQKLFSMTNEIQARQLDGDASSLRGSESIEVRLILFERSREHHTRRG